MNTTIAQALRQAKKLKGRIDESRSRAAASVSFYSDSPPAFLFSEQLSRADATSTELAELQGQLAVANATNSITHEGKSLTLAHAVRHLQELKSRIAWLRALVVKPQASMQEMVSVYMPNVGHTSVPRPVECKLPEAQKAGIIDLLQEQFDSLNAAVEEANQRVTI